MSSINAGMSPRTLIRYGVLRALEDSPATAALFGDRMYGNRTEHWLAEELPAVGVYTLSEEPLESDVSPDPMERRISLVVEILARMTVKVDDGLDALAWTVEKTLHLDAVGAAMTDIVNEARADHCLELLPPVIINGIPRASAVDTLLALKLTGIEIGIAVEGDRQIGVAAMSFDLDYIVPEILPPLADFLLAVTGWDVEEHDGVIDMVSKVEFEASPPVGQKPAKPGITPGELAQIDAALKIHS